MRNVPEKDFDAKAAARRLYARLKKSLGIVGEDWLNEAVAQLGKSEQETGGSVSQHFDSKVNKSGTEIKLTVSNDHPQAAVIHQGWASEKANPGMPPVQPIADWVMRKTALGVNDPAQAKGIAFAIARKMKKDRQFGSLGLRRRPEAPQGGSRFFEIPAKKKQTKWFTFIAEDAAMKFEKR